MMFQRVFVLSFSLLLGVIGLGWLGASSLKAQTLSVDIDLVPHARVVHPPLDEISGIVKSRRRDNLYWVHNDSGDSPRIFAIDGDGMPVLPTYARFRHYGGEAESGKTPFEGFRVLFAEHIDWEDMTRDEHYLYIADLGNNANRRKDLVIYAISEIDPTASTQTAVIKRIPVHYPEQLAFPDQERHYDSESLFAADGSLYVITKHRKRAIFNDNVWEPGAWLYRLDGDESEQSNPLTRIDHHPDILAATAAELSPDGQRLAVLSYTALWIFERPDTGDAWLSAPSTRFNFSARQARQVEALAWEDDATVLILNEQRDMFRVVIDPAEYQ